MQRPGKPGAARSGRPRAAPTTGRALPQLHDRGILTGLRGPRAPLPPPPPPPRGGLLQFGVQALLAARPFHSHLGTCGAGGRGALAGLGGRKRAAASAGRSSGHAGPGSFLRRVQAGKQRGQAPGRAETRPRAVGQASRRAFPLFFTATLWFPAPRSPAQGPEPASPSRAHGPDCECQTSGQATSGRAPGPSPQDLGVAVAAQAGKLDLTEEARVSECCAGG